MRDRIPFAVRFWAKVDKGAPDACWPWTGKVDRKGYGRFGVRRGGRKGTVIEYGAHRVAWALTKGGPLAPNELVCHTCDNPPCCNATHFFVGSIADNNADRDAKGRGNKGTKNGASKLTEDDVRAIRRRYNEGGILQRELATEFGIGQPIVARILSRKLWNHVP